MPIESQGRPPVHLIANDPSDRVRRNQATKQNEDLKFVKVKKKYVYA